MTIPLRAVVFALAALFLLAVPARAHAQAAGQPVVVKPIAKPPFAGKGKPGSVLPKEVGEARKDIEKMAGELADKAANKSPAFDNSRVAALWFWLFGLMTLGGALFVITRRNPIAAVMGMVGTFFALAGLYLMLYASFMAAVQVLVYAGAIMVLFVFVVMILNRPEDEPWALQGLLGKALAGGAILYLTGRLASVLWTLKDTPHAVIAAARPVAEVAAGDPGDFGSVRAIGNTLFHDYLFPFEAVSLVLLVAVVGAIAVARPHKKDELPAGGAGEGAGAP